MIDMGYDEFAKREELSQTLAFSVVKGLCSYDGDWLLCDFSGGEKKKNEIFQMAMLDPIMSFLDETDSGLDIDALRIVANGVNKLRSSENAIVVITHYQRLLDYIVPDFVHVLYEGKIVKSGTKELALELEAKGYEWIREELESKQK